MIARTKRWDWFEVDLETGKPLAQVPGVRYVNGKFQLHRTHLPLLRGRNDELDACVDERLDGAGYEFVGDAARARAAGADLELRPWQAEALDWIAPRRGCLLADEMRLGKTLTALLSHDPDTGPLVILAPLDTRAVWLRWLAVVFPDVPVHVIEGKAVDPEAMREARIVFGHFDILTYHQSTVVQPGTLIVDEAHLLSNPRSKRSKSVLFYSGVAKRVILLSGTPMWNTSRGLWTLFAATGAGAWGKEFDFAQRYCSPEMTEYGWKYNGVSNRAEWHARRSECVLARTWREVRPDLPPPRRQTVAVPLDPDQRFEVDFAAAELMAGAKQLDVTVLARYRQAVGRYKTSLAADLALAHRGPILVWTWHKQIAQAIAKRVSAESDRETFVMSGESTGAKRAKTIDAWNATEAGVMVATLAVGQVGIDLSHARKEIFVETDWTPAVLSQAEVRPFHPDRDLDIVYITLDHEIDQALTEAVVKKVDRGHSFDLAAAGSVFEDSAVAAQDDDRDILRDLAAALGLAA